MERETEVNLERLLKCLLKPDEVVDALPDTKQVLTMVMQQDKIKGAKHKQGNLVPVAERVNVSSRNHNRWKKRVPAQVVL